MPINIEVKAKAHDWSFQVRTALALADRKERLRQYDTFFNCGNGRLKLRRQRGMDNYLIFYRRTGIKSPKASDYTLIPVPNPAKTARRLTRLLGVTKRVTKCRLVCHIGRTRVHLDEVKGLGRFIELEVVLKPGESPGAGKREAASLMRKLGIMKVDLLKGSYADML